MSTDEGAELDEQAREAAEKKRAAAEAEAQRRALLQKRAEERRRQEEEENERARERLEQERIEAEKRAEEEAQRAEEERIKRIEWEAAEKVRLELEAERLRKEAEAEERRKKEKAERKVKEEADRKAREEAEEREAERKAKEKAERRAAEAAARETALAAKKVEEAASGGPLPDTLTGDFVASEDYAGSKEGYTYRSGDHGQGYYKNPEEPPPPAPQPAPQAGPQSAARPPSSNPPPKRSTRFASFLHETAAPAPALTPAQTAAAPQPMPVEERIAKLKAQGPPKRVKPENRYLKKLLLALAPITKMEVWEIDGEMNTFKQHRIKTLEHLLILIGHKDYWAKLELSVMTKCAIEEALTHPRVREVGEPKEKIRALRAAIQAGEVVVPTSDVLLAEMEGQAPKAPSRGRADFSSSSSSSDDSRPNTPKGAAAPPAAASRVSPRNAAPGPTPHTAAASPPKKHGTKGSSAVTTVAPVKRNTRLIVSVALGVLLVSGIAALFLVPELRAMLPQL